MEFFWPLLIVLGALVVLMVVLLSGSAWFSGTRWTTRLFWCPFREQDVSVEFREMVWDGRLVDVRQCTYFDPPTANACDRRCLGLKRFPQARGLTTTA
jgi:hypothetical protein